MESSVVVPVTIGTVLCTPVDTISHHFQPIFRIIRHHQMRSAAESISFRLLFQVCCCSVAPQKGFLLIYSVLRFNRHGIHVSSLYSRRPGLQGRQEKKKLKLRKKKHEVLPYNVKREPLYSIYSISTHPHRIGDFNNELVMCGSIFARWPPLSSSETNAAISQVMEQPPLQY